MNFGKKRRPVDPAIDLTNLIDVMFNLVLFFVVTTTFNESQGFQVDLPRSSAQTLVASDEDVNILVTCGRRLEGGACEDGPIYVGEEQVTMDELRALLVETAEEDLGTIIVVRADKGVTHGRVVEVMDLAQSLQLTHLAIATEPGRSDEP